MKREEHPADRPPLLLNELVQRCPVSSLSSKRADHASGMAVLPQAQPGSDGRAQAVISSRSGRAALRNVLR